ncbi:hypothetical protein PHYSODRAFT_534686 [Phytophthora sojae]|uniref:Uncharacterized protein n=1 Tax=Phytophthora sojae (strain P6497) TaxID=1094619 RepID=G5AHB8_PHYSP|nr:hypothetical protein PHYSODRAFT_534686 [Phytophthora sojae]EGZ05096.1 hypothetical protein PHYSODRAFT_534686 [Phytophthora sojae]|eukprot:XP_009539468.1 hypothetical protein PHYSODRAFT_534686 [Phytophthora sojae]
MPGGSSSRRVLSPRPAPRVDGNDAVVVVAQEALATAALGWQQRAERLERDNARLRERVAEVEETLRRSRTVVKNVPTLPNNHVFTKQLVDENHALRRETRALQRRLMQVRRNLPRTNSADLARHPLVQALKTHLRDLEVDLERLQKENELLRTELDESSLRMFVDALQQQVKVLEARYQHLEEKARAKAALYRESTSRLEEMSAQLFEAQQQLAVQAEKLHVYSDQSAQMEDLQQEMDLLRSENLKLNDTVAALSSRPFDALSKDLQKKNLWVAQIEKEKRGLEEDCAKLQQDCFATRRTNDHLRRRVEAMTIEAKDLARELSQAKAECEQRTMEKEVAQLQLRFYTAPGDYALMSAVGKALKEMKKQHTSVEIGSGHSAVATANRK